MSGWIYRISAWPLIIGRLVCVLLSGCSHTGFIGGADIDPIPESQMPPVAIAEFRKAHPAAKIDRLERTLSNAPLQYRIRYRDVAGLRCEFIYGDCSLGSDLLLYPDAVKDAFGRRYPG